MGEAKRRSMINIPVKPKDGFYLCKKCKGTGFVFITDEEYFRQTYNGKFLKVGCDTCKGTGQVNWIENIFGKEERLTPTVKEVDLSTHISNFCQHLTFGEYQKLYNKREDDIK